MHQSTPVTKGWQAKLAPQFPLYNTIVLNDVLRDNHVTPLLSASCSEEPGK